MATSLDALLQADRLKRRNEQLAQQLLGKGRRSSTPSNGIRKPGPGGSLASRIGVTKRSFSATPKSNATNRASAAAETQRTITAASSRNARSIRENPMGRRARKERTVDDLVRMDVDLDVNSQANIINGDVEITIRGAAGPYTVIGKNFAPGTTAADIESAMGPIGGPMEDCRIISHKPTVVAEMVFLEKAKAENVIATFDSKRADGRLLSLSLKAGKPSNPSKTAPQDPPRIDLTRADSPHTEAPHNEASRVQPPRNAPSEPKAARGDLTYEENSYAHHREQSDRDRRRAAPEFQDGSYGFEQKEDRMEVDNNNRRDYNHNRPRQYGGGRDVGRPAVERRLYSDDLYPRHGGRGFR